MIFTFPSFLLILLSLLLSPHQGGGTNFVVEASVIRNTLLKPGTEPGNMAFGLSTSTDDGKTWSSEGWPYASVRAVLHTQSGAVLLGCDHGILKKRDSSWALTSDWRFKNTTCFVEIAGSPSRILAGTAHGLWVSFDVGDSWSDLTPNLPEDDTRYINAFALDTSGTVFAATENGCLVSHDSGFTWSRAGLVKKRVRDLALHKGSGLLAAATRSGVFFSSDRGKSWLRRSEGLLSTKMTCILADTTRDNTFYAGTTDMGIFRTTDGGKTWTPGSFGITNYFIHSLYIDHALTGRIYAGTDGGLFVLKPGHDRWDAFGLGSCAISAVHVHPLTQTGSSNHE